MFLPLCNLLLFSGFDLFGELFTGFEVCLNGDTLLLAILLIFED